MAKSLPGLVFKIGANTKDAIDGLNKVNRAVGQSTSLGTRLSASWRKAGPAFMAAGAAASAMAVAIGVEAVQAAMQEQQSVDRLNKSLSNLGFPQASERVGEFIDNLQFAANVADTDLRTAFQTLLRGTHDITEAQDALNLALDISAGTGRDLAQVSTALGRAYAGNFTGLGRLGAGLTKAELKTGDMVAITAKLRDTFGGQASTQANTLAGSVKGVQIAWSELVESFGMGLTGAGSEDAKKLQEIEATLRNAQPAAERAGESVRNLGVASLTFFDRISAANAVLERGDWGNFWAMMQAGASGNDEWFSKLANSAQNAGDQFKYVQYEAYKARDYTLDYKTAAEDATVANDGQTASLKRLQTALSNLSGQRGLMRQRLDLSTLLSAGPSKSGSRKGAGGKMTQFTTLADRKEYALTVADQYAGLASGLLGEGKRGQARNQLRAARQTIAGMNLPGAFESNLLQTLRTPTGMRPSGVLPGTPQTGAQVAGVNYNFYGDIKVDSNAALTQTAKEARRLAALSGDRYAGMAATGKGYRR